MQANTGLFPTYAPTATTGVAGGGFGEDTSIVKANAAAIDKTIWEGIASYTSSINGAEASQYQIKVLQAGAQVVAQQIGGQGTLFTAGFYDGTPANTRAAVATGDVGTGMRKYVGGSALAFSINGFEFVYLTKTSNNDGAIEIDGTFSKIVFNNDCEIGRSVDASSTQSNLQLFGKFGAGTTDVAIGPPGVLANNAVGGHLQIPTCAGVPTGILKLNTGKAGLILGNTGAVQHLYAFFAGAWAIV